jgi:uncharacterized membrane protein YcaP (DUF421 family)
MDKGLLSVDWRQLLVPGGSLLELFLRGTAIYFFILILVRFLVKKKIGAPSVSDLILIVLIADASQKAMAGNYNSVTEGFFLIATLMLWDYCLDFLSYRFKFIRPFLHPEPVMIINKGKMLKKEMAKELISEDELATKMREEGIDNIAKVKQAFVEGNGEISFILFKKES